VWVRARGGAPAPPDELTDALSAAYLGA
jgi:hypothetical protein